jgi:hypothetical protein
MELIESGLAGMEIFSTGSESFSTDEDKDEEDITEVPLESDSLRRFKLEELQEMEEERYLSDHGIHMRLRPTEEQEGEDYLASGQR